MKRIISIFVCSIMLMCFAFSASAASISITPSNPSNWTSSVVVGDYNRQWYTYVSSVSFYGMPDNYQPSNYELYIRPYTSVNGKQASDAVTYRYRSSANWGLPASIGHTGISQGYKNSTDPRGASLFGSYGYAYTFKFNSTNSSSLGQTIYYSLTA